jgi:hypothetical protein
MIEKGAILPLFYLPPVAYFSAIQNYSPDFVIEAHEHFPKQTYRNRASIYSPDGKLDLVVPVVKGAKVQTPVKDVRISYDFDWQRQHWMSLQACYRRSAYFEYYEDEFVIFYEQHKTFLFDYNEMFLHVLLKLLKINPPLNYTHDYQEEYPNLIDFREDINPKKEFEFDQKPYYQVFEERLGFLKNLSIVDLLFNQGPQSIHYL